MEDLREYDGELESLFTRFRSVQTGSFASAYKPGLERMNAFSELLGHPERKFSSIHVAGTNGKGSVSSMLASVYMAKGCKTGLYTSPHILDFRERMKVDGNLPPKDWVLSFIRRYKADFERLDLSFFDITTGMAFSWFASEGCDEAIVEVGMGGRLDSTNIILPQLCIVTSIGLDHCEWLGGTLEEIAAEKAGIFKEGVPAVIGQTLPQTAPVFRSMAKGPLYFAEDHPVPEDLLSGMDLRGEYQRANLRTVLTALDVLGVEADRQALAHTAERTGLRGRWEKLGENPEIICDIGHNAPALEHNFRQLEASGKPLRIVYAVMADKDLDAIMPLMPVDAEYYFATPSTPRALPSQEILRRYSAFRGTDSGMSAFPDVPSAVKAALEQADTNDLIYIGGSTFAVADAVKIL